jgi:pyruvate/2-oxoglutarate/acetoin dehydrogenase E1 component/TPP-dependent pyruvate/acetoin dehydrogenase alpha subunit
MSVLLPTARVSLGRDEVLADYRVAVRSRIASQVGQREVLSGSAKFGIFGDGKEVAQVALAKAFAPGDWRAGYYRDQTLAMALGMTTVQGFFHQLYSNPDPAAEPASGGRQMVNHIATRFLDENGLFVPTVGSRNSSADVSCMAGWMPRLLGLAYASKLYRDNPNLREVGASFSANGNEVVFGSIGDASTSEGLFFEAMNAAGVLQVPIALSVWDDGQGISVPTALQTTKASISEAMAGFAQTDDKPGIRIHVVRGWDYPALCDMYISAVQTVRRDHVPTLFHVTELTQPQGHSTSGSHQRYKSPERLQWERDHDCLTRMRAWMVEGGIAEDADLDKLHAQERDLVEAERVTAWEAVRRPIAAERSELLGLLAEVGGDDPPPQVAATARQLAALRVPRRRDIETAAVAALIATRNGDDGTRAPLQEFLSGHRARSQRLYRSHLVSESPESPLRVPAVAPEYSDQSPTVDGRMVLVRCFDENFGRDPRIFVIGEDVGRLGDVNLVFEGLQAKYGDRRLTDTGIREATILGQAIGASMRGLRPIADIQYLDYFLFALQTASDDLASLHWRTHGGQKAPVVIRTKGHRLEGIWHSGSPMAAILDACRGIHLCVPRDMTRAAGFYNTLFRGDDPGMVIEVLNGYRIKERVPDNVGTFTLPLGVPEVLREGSDVTVVTYGGCCRLALEAAEVLAELGVELEVIDVQTLAPFDVEHRIAASLAKTGAVVFLDEDVPGGATAYMFQQVLENQQGWWHLDAAPRTIPAAENRCASASDGDYFCKPNREDIVLTAYQLMRERRPADFPAIFDGATTRGNGV